MNNVTYNLSKSDQDTCNVLDQKLALPVIDGHSHIFGQDTVVGEKFHHLSQAGKVVFFNHDTKQCQVFTAPVTLLDMGERDKITIGARGVVDVPAAEWPISLTARGRADALTRCVALKDPTIECEGLNKYYKWIEVAIGGLMWLGRLHSFGRDAAGSELANAGKLLKAHPLPKTHPAYERPIAFVSLLVDFGYTPTNMPKQLAKPKNKENTLTHELLSGRNDLKAYYFDNDADPARLCYKKDQYRWTIESQAEVAAEHPGQCWPFVAFDPRRARDSEMEKSEVVDADAQPLSALGLVKEAINTLGHVGVKLYGRCGWMPLGNKLMYNDPVGGELDDKLRELYQYLVDNDIPVLAHTSPTGFPPSGSTGDDPVGFLVLPGNYAANKGWGLAPPITVAESERLKGRNEYHHVALKAAVMAYNYCHYVQNTVSPYAWEVVLNEPKFKKLRLNLGHSGGEESILARYEDGWLKAEVEAGRGTKELVDRPPMFLEAGLLTKAEFLLLQSPWVAAGQTFKERLFPEFVKWCAIGLNSDAQPQSHASYPKIKKAVDDLLATTPWSNALNTWASQYPDDWFTRIIALQQNDQHNVYSDLSYLSGARNDKTFAALLEAVVNDATKGAKPSPGKASQGSADHPPSKSLKRKIIIGTDWYMTAKNDISPQDFWDRVTSVVSPISDPRLFELWATENVLEWLNLKPRIPAMENWYKTRGLGKEPPKWWNDLREWYGLPRT